MRYYLTFVGLGLLMGGLCLLLQIHPTPPPAIAMMGLFGAHAHEGQHEGSHDAGAGPRIEPDAAWPDAGAGPSSAVSTAAAGLPA